VSDIIRHRFEGCTSSFRPWVEKSLKFRRFGPLVVIPENVEEPPDIACIAHMHFEKPSGCRICGLLHFLATLVHTSTDPHWVKQFIDMDSFMITRASESSPLTFFDHQCRRSSNRSYICLYATGNHISLQRKRPRSRLTRYKGWKTLRSSEGDKEDRKNPDSRRLPRKSPVRQASTFCHPVSRKPSVPLIGNIRIFMVSSRRASRMFLI